MNGALLSAFSPLGENEWVYRGAHGNDDGTGQPVNAWGQTGTCWVSQDAQLPRLAEPRISRLQPGRVSNLGLQFRTCGQRGEPQPKPPSARRNEAPRPWSRFAAVADVPAWSAGSARL